MLKTAQKPTQPIQSAHGAKQKTSIPAKARFGQPYGKNGRLGGHIGETGSRNMAATQKNQLFDPGFLFAPSDSFSLGRTVSPQYIRQPDKRSSYLQELVWQPSWQLDTCASVYTVNCELSTASAQRPVPTAGHALWSRGPLHSSHSTPLHSTPLTGRAIKPQRQGHIGGPIAQP